MYIDDDFDELSRLGNDEAFGTGAVHRCLSAWESGIFPYVNV
jgi:hypothetical protein